MRQIEEVRKEINEIDRQIVDLFLRRMKCSEEVSEFKMHTGGQVLVTARENELLNTMLEKVPESLKQEYTSLLRTTTRISRKYQYTRILKAEPFRLQLPITARIDTPQSVCYQGLEASYQEAAVKALFPEAHRYHLKTFEDVFLEVSEGRADAGVVPIENSTAGTINEVYDLLEKHGLYISHSYIGRISHCLAACEGASLDTIKTVHSHPQALRQCHYYIQEHDLAEVEESNTAIAADEIAKSGDITRAAICSEEAAERYGLNIIQSNINDGDFNQTRFIAVTRGLSAKKEDNRVSLILIIPHVTGSLYAALSVFSDYGLNMTEIHSRPLANMPWNYCFYIDFAGNILNEDTRTMIYQLTQEIPVVRILGSFPVIEEEGLNTND
ncbi:MAG: bifunctional chorismate mutase/prephenate dehydratase [Eubacteriales bacterium]|nr:bifunctional chorismate mutase/prephenate dehydratase [Eubacteriales bacterium]